MRGLGPHPSDRVYDLADGKIKMIRIVTDRKKALEAAGVRE